MTLSTPNANYRSSDSLMDESVQHLPHTAGPAIYWNDTNKMVLLKINEATHITLSVKSTVKAFLFSRHNDGQEGAFNVPIATNHVGDTKYRAIMKKHMNLLLQSIKWRNGHGAYPL